MILQEEYYLRKNITDCLIHKYIPEGQAGYLLFKRTKTTNNKTPSLLAFISIVHQKGSHSPNFHKVSICYPGRNNIFNKAIDKDGEEEFNQAYFDNYVEVIMQSARQLCDQGFRPVFDLTEAKFVSLNVFLYCFEKNLIEIFNTKLIDEVYRFLILETKEEKLKCMTSILDAVHLIGGLRDGYESAMRLSHPDYYFNWLESLFVVS